MDWKMRPRRCWWSWCDGVGRKIHDGLVEGSRASVQIAGRTESRRCREASEAAGRETRRVGENAKREKEEMTRACADARVATMQRANQCSIGTWPSRVEWKPGEERSRARPMPVAGTAQDCSTSRSARFNVFFFPGAAAAERGPVPGA